MKSFGATTMHAPVSGPNGSRSWNTVCPNPYARHELVAIPLSCTKHVCAPMESSGCQSRRRYTRCAPGTPFRSTQFSRRSTQSSTLNFRFLCARRLTMHPRGQLGETWCTRRSRTTKSNSGTKTTSPLLSTGQVSTTYRNALWACARSESSFQSQKMVVLGIFLM